MSNLGPSRTSSPPKRDDGVFPSFKALNDGMEAHFTIEDRMWRVWANVDARWVNPEETHVYTNVNGKKVFPRRWVLAGVSPKLRDAHQIARDMVRKCASQHAKKYGKKGGKAA